MLQNMQPLFFLVKTERWGKVVGCPHDSLMYKWKQLK